MAARKKTAKRKSATMVAKKTSTRVSTTKAKRGGTKSAKGAIKRASAKRTATQKAANPKKAAPISVGRKAYSKGQLVSTIVDQTGLARKEVVGVLECISSIIGAHVKKQGPGTFSWPGLFKVLVVNKPATKARQGTNPFTGEPMTFKAKPASRRIKIRALKQLKAMAG